jgi:hypothetical protein
MIKLKYAKDYKCCKCENQAVAFWPVCDPDIPEHPYCRKCLDGIKHRITMEVLGIPTTTIPETAGKVKEPKG